MTAPFSRSARSTIRLGAGAIALSILVGTALAQAPAAPSAAPTEPPPASAAKPAGPGGAQTSGSRRAINPERVKAFRDQLRKHVEDRLAAAKRVTTRLEEALRRLDAGEDVRDIKDLVDAIPNLNRRGESAKPGSAPAGTRDGTAPGTPAPRPERAAAGLFGFDAEPVRPLSPEELDDTVAQIREHNPEGAEQLERLRDDQPLVFKRVVEWIASRTTAIREARERGDRPMVQARWDEIRAMLDMFRIARELEHATLDAGGSASPPSPASVAAREALQARMRDALGRQFDARMEIQALQIVALEARTGEMRRNLESLRSKRDDVIRDGASRAASLGTKASPKRPGAGNAERRGEGKPRPESDR